ncbi:MAG: RNA ligase [Patescibacteria group bacterium]
MELKTSLGNVWQLIRELVAEGIAEADEYREWASDNEEFIADILQYRRLDGMPAASALIKPFFHPEEPLIGVNYTPVAHNTLFRFPSGWTPTLRICRGLVFSRRGALMALPFPKFFNDREHEETSNIRDDTHCLAAEKRDGHLGIIFKHQSRWMVTTRGSFTSKTAIIAQAMLDKEQAKNPHGWRNIDKRATLLVEIIHPETKVIVDYGGAERFDLIGGYNAGSLKPIKATKLTMFGHWLGFDPVLGTMTTVGKLREEVKRLNVKNHEGYVATMPGGQRVKFKYAGYVSKMMGDKFTYPYMMRRMLEGDFKARIADLDPEIQMRAHEMALNLVACLEPSDTNERVKQLVSLMPQPQRSSEALALCRKFAKLNTV